MSNLPMQSDASASTKNLELNTCCYAITHLGAIAVTGADAVAFLQGQCTCDVQALQEGDSTFGAFCNAKGRVISTFIISKNADRLLLILPLELLPLVLKRLRLYILRSKVSLQDLSASHRLIGLGTEALAVNQLNAFIAGEYLLLPYPRCEPNRYLVIYDALQPDPLTAINNPFQLKTCSAWQYLDIKAGIAWLSTANTEEYIPQMLNLDQLGGISFNKGCYTGQEVVARTHYLGKSKRSLYVAKLMQAFDLNANCVVTTSHDAQKVGNILNYVRQAEDIYMLLVLNIDVAEVSTLLITTDTQVSAEISLCH